MSESFSIDVLEVGDFLTNCYLIHCDGKAIVIDPGDEPEKIIGLIEQISVKVEKIILTHGHIDHIKALPEVRQATRAPVFIHQEDAIMLTDAKRNLSYYHDTAFTTKPTDELLIDGDEIILGNHTIKVLHTPGHSTGGISFLMDDIILTGDALFLNSIGRTDLPGSDHTTLIKAINDKLMSLPPETRAYPGHGPQTTIGHEKENNPWLS